jgi:hypothetical protein
MLKYLLKINSNTMNQFFKKILVILFLIQGVHSAEFDKRQDGTPSYRSFFQGSVEQVRNHLSFLFIPSEKPTYASVLCKAGAGLMLSWVAGAIEDMDDMSASNPYHAYPAYGCRMISSKLCFDAIGEGLSLVYETIHFPQMEARAKKHGGRICSQRGTNLTDQEVYDIVSQGGKENLAYLSRMGRYLFNTATITYGVYIYLNNLGELVNEGFNPFSFSSEGMSCSTSTLLCRPLTTPVFLALYMATLGYNLRELSFATNISSFIKRGDVPFFNFFNGYSIIAFSAAFIRMQGIDPQELETVRILSKQIREISKLLGGPDPYDQYVGRLSKFDLNVYYGIRNYGNYQLFESALLTLKNLFFYFRDRPYIEVIESPSPAPFLRHPRKMEKSELNKPFSGNDPVPEKIEYFPDFEEKKKPEASENIKQKTKTRGVPDIRRSKGKEKSRNRGKERGFPLEKPTDDKEDMRHQRLEKLKSLREQYPVKVLTIDRALKDLQNFLDAEVVLGDGNERRLQWELNNKKYFIKYETPHGKDSSVYKGNKLDRILNILEVGYLIGLNEEEINSYIAENQRYNLLRFPKFIGYLIGHPNK